MCYTLGVKTCSKCQSRQPLLNFDKNKKNAGGLQNRCKACVSEANHQRYLKYTPEQKLAIRERGRRFVQNRPGYANNARLKAYFKMTQQDYDSMVEKQFGKCAICGEIPKGGKVLHVDHDHSCCPTRTTCGKCIRGLLCQECNHGLGKFHDNITALEQAVKYLSSFLGTVAT